MIFVVQHVVARLTDFEIKLVVRTDRQILPAVRFVLGQVGYDHSRLLRPLVQVGEHVVDLVDLIEFGNVERAILEGDAVRPIEALGDDFYFAAAAFIDDRIHLVPHAVANEYHRAIVVLRERACVSYAAGIDLDFEALRRLELVDRQLVRSGCDRRSRHRGELRSRLIVGGTIVERRSRRQRCRGRGSRRGRWCSDNWELDAGAGVAAGAGAAAGASAAGGCAGVFCCWAMAVVARRAKVAASNVPRGARRIITFLPGAEVRSRRLPCRQSPIFRPLRAIG